MGFGALNKAKNMKNQDLGVSGRGVQGVWAPYSPTIEAPYSPTIEANRQLFGVTRCVIHFA